MPSSPTQVPNSKKRQREQQGNVTSDSSAGSKQLSPNENDDGPVRKHPRVNERGTSSAAPVAASTSTTSSGAEAAVTSAADIDSEMFESMLTAADEEALRSLEIIPVNSSNAASFATTTTSSSSSTVSLLRSSHATSTSASLIPAAIPYFLPTQQAISAVLAPSVAASASTNSNGVATLATGAAASASLSQTTAAASNILDQPNTGWDGSNELNEEEIDALIESFPDGPTSTPKIAANVAASAESFNPESFLNKDDDVPPQIATATVPGTPNSSHSNSSAMPVLPMPQATTYSSGVGVASSSTRHYGHLPVDEKSTLADFLKYASFHFRKVGGRLYFSAVSNGEKEVLLALPEVKEHVRHSLEDNKKHYFILKNNNCRLAQRHEGGVLLTLKAAAKRLIELDPGRGQEFTPCSEPLLQFTESTWNLEGMLKRGEIIINNKITAALQKIYGIKASIGMSLPPVSSSSPAQASLTLVDAQKIVDEMNKALLATSSSAPAPAAATPLAEAVVAPPTTAAMSSGSDAAATTAATTAKLSDQKQQLSNTTVPDSTPAGVIARKATDLLINIINKLGLSENRDTEGDICLKWSGIFHSASQAHSYHLHANGSVNLLLKAFNMSGDIYFKHAKSEVHFELKKGSKFANKFQAFIALVNELIKLQGGKYPPLPTRYFFLEDLIPDLQKMETHSNHIVTAFLNAWGTSQPNNTPAAAATSTSSTSSTSSMNNEIAMVTEMQSSDEQGLHTTAPDSNPATAAASTSSTSSSFSTAKAPSVNDDHGDDEALLASLDSQTTSNNSSTSTASNASAPQPSLSVLVPTSPNPFPPLTPSTEASLDALFKEKPDKQQPASAVNGIPASPTPAGASSSSSASGATTSSSSGAVATTTGASSVATLMAKGGLLRQQPSSPPSVTPTTTGNSPNTATTSSAPAARRL